MGIKDRILWSADRTISKIRNKRGQDEPESEDPVINYTLDDMDTSAIQESTVHDTEVQMDKEQHLAPEPEPVRSEVQPVKEEVKPIPTPLPLVRRANRVTRGFRASSRSIDLDSAPLGLSFVGVVALVFASLYLMKLFTSLDAMQDDMSFLKRITSAGVLLFLFYQYIGYVITIFQLRSGLRGSWATMVRTSGSYILLMILAETHLFDWLPFDLVSFPSWILVLCMACIMAYMMLPFVREYYKPPYAEMAPLTSWLLFVFWIDPYNDADELGMDIDIPVDL